MICNHQQIERTDPLWRYLDLCTKLQTAQIWHKPIQYRDDAVSVLAAVPGQLWEIDFVTDGTVRVEVYRSEGKYRGEEALAELFADQEISSTERKN